MLLCPIISITTSLGYMHRNTETSAVHPFSLTPKNTENLPPRPTLQGASLPPRGLPVSHLSLSLLPGPIAQTCPCPLLRHHGLSSSGLHVTLIPAPCRGSSFPTRLPPCPLTEPDQRLRPSSVGTSAWEPPLPWADASTPPAGRLDYWLHYVSHQLTSVFPHLSPGSFCPSEAAALDGGNHGSPFPSAPKTHESL